MRPAHVGIMRKDADRGGFPLRDWLSLFRMERDAPARDGQDSKSPSNCKVKIYENGKSAAIGEVRASCSRRAHSDDDLHKSASEGEGACSRVCADCSHLPLRGKLGWMTPRPGQKKTGKRNAPSGALDPKQGPQCFLGVVSALCALLRPNCLIHAGRCRLETRRYENQAIAEF